MEKIFQPDSPFDVEATCEHGNVLEMSLQWPVTKNGEIIDFEILLRHPSVQKMVNVRDKDGETILFRAIKLKKPRIVSFLLQFPGLDLDFVDHEGRNIVQVVVDSWTNVGSQVCGEAVEKCLQELSKHPVVKTMLNMKNKEGDPPIIQLLKHQKLDLVNILLESPEIDLNIRDSAGQDLETIAK